jgi:hypothetical protein
LRCGGPRARQAALLNDHPWLRPCQIEANAAVEQAIAERKRQMLVAMATGTGKTVTMVNQAYRLMKSRLGRRILFLVDRRALAAQAVRTFASFDPEPGLKFDKIYEVFSQRFRREDFEDEKFDPKVLPASYLLDPHKGTPSFTCARFSAWQSICSDTSLLSRLATRRSTTKLLDSISQFMPLMW